MSRGPRVILASASPRRLELLGQLGIEPEVVPAEVDEGRQPGEAARDYAERLARNKADTVWDRLDRPSGTVVLGADTVVVAGGTVLGKPVDRADAIRMLSLLSDRRHQVISAVALCDSESALVVSNVTEVAMRRIERREMELYWSSGEPRDKAGAYAIQGRGAVFVSAIQGSYSAVVGLPLFETASLLATRGVLPLADPGVSS